MFNRSVKIALVILLLANSQLIFAKPAEQTIKQVDKVSHSAAAFKHKLLVSDQSTRKLLEKTVVTARTLENRGLQRNAVNIKYQKKSRLANLGKANKKTQAANFHYSFSIYNGYSQLVTDIDKDGYYQTFSVSFDADLLSPVIDEQALVYANLYLSKNGEPWVLYFSTDDFVITGESTEDEFEVVTKLDAGYAPDHYDVLIDLFEVGYSDVVATYSSNETNALHALPLESSDYDPEYVEVEYVHSEYGGGIDWLLMFLLFAIVTLRR